MVKRPIILIVVLLFLVTLLCMSQEDKDLANIKEELEEYLNLRFGLPEDLLGYTKEQREEVAKRQEVFLWDHSPDKVLEATRHLINVFEQKLTLALAAGNDFSVNECESKLQDLDEIYGWTRAQYELKKLMPGYPIGKIVVAEDLRKKDIKELIKQLGYDDCVVGKDIKELVKQLGDDNWQVRKKAQVELKKLLDTNRRPEVNVALKEALKNEDLEIVLRAKSLLKYSWAKHTRKAQEELKKLLDTDRRPEVYVLLKEALKNKDLERIFRNKDPEAVSRAKTLLGYARQKEYGAFEGTVLTSVSLNYVGKFLEFDILELSGATLYKRHQANGKEMVLKEVKRLRKRITPIKGLYAKTTFFRQAQCKKDFLELENALNDLEKELRKDSPNQWRLADHVKQAVKAIKGITFEFALRYESGGSRGRDEPVFGPSSGSLTHGNDDFIEWSVADVNLADFKAEAVFRTPYSAKDNWDFGFLCRHTKPNTFHAIWVNSSAEWWHSVVIDGNWNYLEHGSAHDWLRMGTNGRNHLRLIVIGNSGEFYVNGKVFGPLDMSGLTDAGRIGVAIGIILGHRNPGKVTRFEDFTVWSLEN